MLTRICQALVKLSFRAADQLAPELAGRVALRLWLKVPETREPTPLPPHGLPFAIKTAEADVRGQVWGAGPVVYFAHGWGGCANQFTAYVKPFVRAGYRVVLFDGLSHGISGEGRLGAKRTHELELSESLDAVCTVFGPAHAIVAHSLGAITTYLSLRRGRTSTQRLVLLAPLVESMSLFERFRNELALGPRTQQAMFQALAQTVGMAVEDSDARRQAANVAPIPTLVVHDRSDRQTAHRSARDLVAQLPMAQMVSTDGLGHRRILQDPAVIQRVLAFMDSKQPLTATI